MSHNRPLYASSCIPAPYLFACPTRSSRPAISRKVIGMLWTLRGDGQRQKRRKVRSHQNIGLSKLVGEAASD
jgi:hypothetical protein